MNYCVRVGNWLEQCIAFESALPTNRVDLSVAESTRRKSGIDPAATDTEHGNRHGEVGGFID
jgi:hypothetical protein